MKEIETKRLLLRSFTLADLDELAPIFGDGDVVRYLGSGKPVSREETEQALVSIIKHRERHGYGRWAVLLRRTRELIGYGGLRSFEGTPELVYLLSKRCWGIGLATEIAEASLRYGFVERQFERIIAMSNLANKASHRVLEKIGMTFENTDHVCGMDIVRYSISRAAYWARRHGDNGPMLYGRSPESADSGADLFIRRLRSVLAISALEPGQNPHPR